MFKFGTQPIINIAFNGAEERPTKSVRIPGGEPQEQ